MLQCVLWEQIIKSSTPVVRREEKKIKEKKAKLKEGRFYSREISGYNRIVDNCMVLCMCRRKQDS